MSTERNNQRDLERQLHQSLCDAGRLIPSTIDDVERCEAHFNEESIDLPPPLRSPFDVLCRIKHGEARQPVDGKPQVFGRLIQMLRKDRGFTISELAEKARIDEQELCRIEAELECDPKPRTVTQLAAVFNVLPKSLARVAKLTRQNDDQITEGLVKFAACAKDMEKLSREEQRALREFVKLLNSMK